MKFADKVDRVLSESVLDYIILTADTYVDSDWKKIKLFVRTDAEFAAMRAARVWLQQEEVPRFRNLQRVGQSNNVPEGPYDNVIDERGVYIEPDRRNIVAQY